MQNNPVQNLSSPDPTTRRDAIYALARTGDPRAIAPLQRAVQSEADPTLRELAEKAVRHLQKLQSQTAPAAAPQEPALPAPPEVDTTSQRVLPAEVSPAKKSLAKGYLDHAINLKLHGKDKDAIDTLIQALAANPGLASDQTARNLAAALIGSGPDEAIKLLLEKSQEPGAIPKKPAITFGSTEEAITLVLELVILFVIMVALNALFQGSIQYGAQGISLSAIKTAAAENPKARIPQDQFDQLEQLYESARTEYNQVKWSAVIPVALGKALVNTLAILLGAVVMYVVGIMIGGTGAPVPFLSSLMQLEIIANFIYVVMCIGVAYVTPHTLATPNISALSNSDLSIVFGAIVIGGLTLVVADIARIIIVGRKHEFGISRGFLCVFLGDIAFGLLVAGLGLFR